MNGEIKFHSRWGRKKNNSRWIKLGIARANEENKKYV